MSPVEIIEYVPQPVMTVEQAGERHNVLVEFVHKMMKKDLHYGTIPGTEKPTLYKPGAELLCMFFGLSPRYMTEVASRPSPEDRYPYINYVQKCQLWKGDELRAEGQGSCNTYERRYRWRRGSRKCPTCEAEAIIRGRQEYGGGWVCWKKKGGCGANFKIDDEKITSQSEEDVLNEDMWDLDNTVLKMANKRALIAATLGMGASREFFTQDMEDDATLIKHSSFDRFLEWANVRFGFDREQTTEALKEAGYTGYAPSADEELRAALIKQQEGE